MHHPFHLLFEELAAQHLLTPKEVSFSTGKSGSTVYRWLRGESTPDIYDFVHIIRSADHEARRRLIAWLSHELPVRVEWLRTLEPADIPVATPEQVAPKVKDMALVAVESFLEVIRWHDTEVGSSPTLSVPQYEALVHRLDDVMEQIMQIKEFHKLRLMERRRARLPAPGDSDPPGDE